MNVESYKRNETIHVEALDNGLGRTPAMGWNSWNKFGCNINEKLFKETADSIVSLGLKDLGYEYVNMDDCWQVSREENSTRIVEDQERFPGGIKNLADYVHEKGLKFGLYSDAGEKTCAGRPGSLGFEEVDAQVYAEWEVDYLKYDNCYNDKQPARPRYTAMRDALNKTGRPIFYSMCNWGEEDPATWAAEVANSWRTTEDIQDLWASVAWIALQNDKWAKYAAPGGWNDPDMLEVGNGGLSLAEERTHFSLWAAMKSPLMIGCDLQTISDESLAILKNEEVIAVNQDKLGVQAKVVKSEKSALIWAGPLDGGDIVVILWNRFLAPRTMTFSLLDVGARKGSGVASVRDLWARADVGSLEEGGEFKDTVEGHGVKMYRLSFGKEKRETFNLFWT
uniref:Alpha-galactosidase n=1 Tax=Chromera velia CCMP2878 TaxID=1169474 RepID=A0A0G4HG19_9ALVE|eukprot:Cvel_27102.t1-p1 / transcript=Cvel_27102.t1 / gene=Cvel_27102 / organism=Chromera_velia_CCMP2878 / gene_product=Alpha-galactosidase, putative / transcript_product=Alpha-galactosidase, putative / location=Cvel_scaffold3324:3616-7364(-) / protein_length=393 / sequence_SO=supercontig / SO=protein_coding / is_pseudo=false